MKKLVFSEVVFSKRALKDLEDSKTLISKAVTNHFVYLCSAKYKDGMDLIKQKMFSKVSDKLEEATESAELSDETVWFLSFEVSNYY